MMALRSHARTGEGAGEGCRLMILAHPPAAATPPTALRKSPAPFPRALPSPGEERHS